LSSGTIGGSGTTNYVPRFTGSTTIGNSQIIDNGTNVLVNKTSDSGQKFQVNGTGLFSNSLEIAGASPVLRVRTDANIANIAYIKDNFEEAVSLKFDDSSNEFAIITNVENYPIRIQPHGTGNIKIPNVPTGVGDVLMRDASNNLVRGVTSAKPLKWEQTTLKNTATNGNILAADTGSLTFTPAQMANGKSYKIEVYHGANDFLYDYSEYMLKFNSTPLNDPDWEFNWPQCYANIILTFGSGNVSVGIFAQGQLGGNVKNYAFGAQFLLIDTTINQVLSLELTDSYDGETTFYSKCEILN
jgi:hypothetical protein